MKSIPLFLLFNLLFFTISCGDKKEESVSDIEIPQKIEEPIVEEASEENLFVNFESQPNMKTWMDFYKSHDSDLSLNNFNLEESQKLKLMEGNVKGNFDPNFDKTYEPFLIYNPSKTMYLDIDSYNWEVDKEGTTLFNSDSEINLVNLNDKSVSRIAYYGPSYWVDDAFWLSDSIFALLENNYDNQPSIQIYNLKKNIVSPYVYSDTLSNMQQRSYLKKRLQSKGIKTP